MHAISSYHGNRPTNKQTHPQTHEDTHTHTHKPTDRTDYNTLHRSFASAQCNKLGFAVFGGASRNTSSLTIVISRRGHGLSGYFAVDRLIDVYACTNKVTSNKVHILTV